ncbi:gluconate operon transcriptional repressor GntR [Photobacterium sp.]|uniref:gluconate operon transcriptional repressor GntR n=1 Tax=Photobacterium sp. TaxID=660 RepID=UPI00299DA215|nr:gluconate operon transcriptional repressor GntR [Photobacterium sp.]MDX1304362.1 gluconate operon transcriptional repressor GntR [Photobacterium sp.]
MVIKKKRPTLQDVANLVGVTKMTVSRFLRNPTLVSEPLQTKISDAVEELGYIPNRAPDILSNAKSNAIGVLVPSLSNQVFAEVIRGIEKITGPAGYQTMLAHYGYSKTLEEQSIASLLSYNVDGIILSESYHTDRARKMLKTAGIPVIEIMDSVSPAIEQAVGIDNQAAARAMTTTMIAKGRKNIVYFAARLDARTRLKMQGYEQAMLEHGLKPISLQTEDASSFTLGAALLHQMLRDYPDADGIFCTNDDLAVGAIYECQRLGINVPQQIGIAGFHGHDISQIMVPKLATVITPRERIGQTAAEQLLARLKGEMLKEPIIDLDFQIASGESI